MDEELVFFSFPSDKATRDEKHRKRRNCLKDPWLWEMLGATFLKIEHLGKIVAEHIDTFNTVFVDDRQTSTTTTGTITGNSQCNTWKIHDDRDIQNTRSSTNLSGRNRSILFCSCSGESYCPDNPKCRYYQNLPMKPVVERVNRRVDMNRPRWEGIRLQSERGREIINWLVLQVSYPNRRRSSRRQSHHDTDRSFDEHSWQQSEPGVVHWSPLCKKTNKLRLWLATRNHIREEIQLIGDHLSDGLRVCGTARSETEDSVRQRCQLVRESIHHERTTSKQRTMIPFNHFMNLPGWGARVSTNDDTTIEFDSDDSRLQ